jgi:hypothetical protein
MTDEPTPPPTQQAKPPGFWTGKRIAVAVGAILLLMLLFGGEANETTYSEDQAVAYEGEAQQAYEPAPQDSYQAVQQDPYAAAEGAAEAQPTPTETLDAGDMIETELSNSVVYP